MFDKIAVVGAGNVGATAAQRLAEKNLARVVVLVDVIEGVPQGKGLDQWESAPIEGFDTRVIGANDYRAAQGSELFVVTAGIARKPGMSRDDLVRTNADIVQFLKTGSAYYAPSAAAVQMVESIVLDKKRILPCAAWLEGEYGLSGIYCGVPCKLGRKGLEQILQVKLSPEEKAALAKSADAVKETMAAVTI